MSLPVSSHNRSASLCSPSSFTFVLLLLPLPFGRTDRSLQLLFYPRRTTLPQFSVLSLSDDVFPSSSLLPGIAILRTEFRREKKRWKLLASWTFWKDSSFLVTFAMDLSVCSTNGRNILREMKKSKMKFDRYWSSKQRGRMRVTRRRVSSRRPRSFDRNDNGRSIREPTDPDGMLQPS